MSIEAVGFAPGVTEVGDSAQVAVGVDPLTAQESCTAAFPKDDPFSGAMVIWSVTFPPGCRVKLPDAAAREKSGPGVIVTTA